MLESLAKNWRSFAWAWAFILWFVLAGLTVSAYGYGEIFFWCSMPLFFVSFYRATRPWSRGTASYWHTVFWALLVPFLLGIPLSALWHGLAYVVRVHGA